VVNNAPITINFIQNQNNYGDFSKILKPTPDGGLSPPNEAVNTEKLAQEIIEKTKRNTA
jgi:hypothetical protein